MSDEEKNTIDILINEDLKKKTHIFNKRHIFTKN